MFLFLFSLCFAGNYYASAVIHVTKMQAGYAYVSFRVNGQTVIQAAESSPVARSSDYSANTYTITTTIRMQRFDKLKVYIWSVGARNWQVESTSKLSIVFLGKTGSLNSHPVMHHTIAL